MNEKREVPREFRIALNDIKQRFTRTSPMHQAESEDTRSLRLKLALCGRTDPARLLTGTDLPAKMTALDALAGDCDTGKGLHDGWYLLDSVRSQVLRSTPPSTVADALRSMEANEGDPITVALRQFYVEAVKPEDLPDTVLRSLITASNWVAPALAARHDIDHLRRILAQNKRVNKYKRLVGAGVFGRERENRTLLGFLTGARAPEARLKTTDWIHLIGPGGIGKSTLLSVALGEVLESDPDTVVVHFDFDRTDLDPARPAALELEFLRQAGDSPATGAGVRGRSRELERAIEKAFDPDSGFSGGPDYVVGIARSLMGGCLMEMDQGKPLIVVLDTFEQIEAGGLPAIDAMKSWLDDVLSATGARDIRVVVSGRCDTRHHFRNDGEPHNVIEVRELNADAAAALLEHHGVPRDAAAAVAAIFRGNPLTLRIAAMLFERVGADEFQQIASAAARGAAPPALIQGVLYDRFLKHLDHPADKYAHPGLVLPELTAELLECVVVPACGAAPETGELVRAFELLQHASWLVRPVRQGRALSLLPELRRLLLQLMTSDSARLQSLARVRAAAVTYHGERLDQAEHRAFHLYHQLMETKADGDLSAFDSYNVAELGEWLRPHIDDLPEAARRFVQAKMLTDLGTEEAIESLSDAVWSQYLLGVDGDPGRGERLVRGADPARALELWRRRPVFVRERLPAFVIRAFVETADWDAPELAGVSAVNDAVDGASDLNRCYWLAMLLALRAEYGGAARVAAPLGTTLEHRALLALLQAAISFQLTDPKPPRGVQALETRLRLVNADQFREVDPIYPKLEEVIVFQDDWTRRLAEVYPQRRGLWRWLRDWLADIRVVLDRPPRGGLRTAYRSQRDDRMSEINVGLNTHGAQKAVNSLHGARLDEVGVVARTLQATVRVDLARAGAARAFLLRGLTPELHRSIRQALRDAFTEPEAIGRLISRFRPALSICPSELEPQIFLARASADPLAWFLALVQFADRARSVETLLDAAIAEAPTAEKLRRVRRAWIAWDRLLCSGKSSDWARSLSAR